MSFPGTSGSFWEFQWMPLAAEQSAYCANPKKGDGTSSFLKRNVMLWNGMTEILYLTPTEHFWNNYWRAAAGAESQNHSCCNTGEWWQQWTFISVSSLKAAQRQGGNVHSYIHINWQQLRARIPWPENAETEGMRERSAFHRKLVLWEFLFLSSSQAGSRTSRSVVARKKRKKKVTRRQLYEFKKIGLITTINMTVVRKVLLKLLFIAFVCMHAYIFLHILLLGSVASESSV